MGFRTKCTNKFIFTFQNKIEKESESGDFIEITAPIGLLTLDVMLRCAFSYDGRIQEQGYIAQKAYYV